jgi:hypothetical protein
LEAIAPPEKVKAPIMEALDRIKETERQDEMFEAWKLLQNSVLGLIRWLRDAR